MQRSLAQFQTANQFCNIQPRYLRICTEIQRNVGGSFAQLDTADVWKEICNAQPRYLRIYTEIQRDVVGFFALECATVLRKDVCGKRPATYGLFICELSRNIKRCSIMCGGCMIRFVSEETCRIRPHYLRAHNEIYKNVTKY